jgi:DNA-binding transcriptional MerR regulator
MDAQPIPTWTIEDLAAQVALALSVNYEGLGDGRIRDVPDLRTIRYYTTLGLIDKPGAIRGRTALYGQRHLLQLVSIKRLQAKGLTLSKLQTHLLGMSDAQLAEVARVPDLGTKHAVPERRSETFWRDRPAPMPPALFESQPERPLHGIRLDAAATLLVAASRCLEADDLEAIQAAAAPLLKVLKNRRLLD